MKLTDAQALKIIKLQATFKDTATRFSNFLKEYQADEPNKASNISEDHPSRYRASTSINPEQNSKHTVINRRIKLPEASLRKFNSRCEDLSSFKDAFKSMFGSQKNLNYVKCCNT